MTNRAIRELPYPASSYISSEMVGEIKAIADDDIRYTDEEVAWMQRALIDLKYWLAEAKRHGRGTDSIYIRIAQVQEQLKVALDQRDG